jgi:hypothetical protein
MGPRCQSYYDWAIEGALAAKYFVLADGGEVLCGDKNALPASFAVSPHCFCHALLLQKAPKTQLLMQ